MAEHYFLLDDDNAVIVDEILGNDDEAVEWAQHWTQLQDEPLRLVKSVLVTELMPQDLYEEVQTAIEREQKEETR